jgi:CheY-like chemotaxis protein
VLVSGEASIVDPLTRGNLGIAASLDKPVDSARLTAVMKKVLAPKPGARARVLHVEPDVETRRLVAYTLGTSADPTGVGSLAEARAALKREAFDLVILNVDLPDGSGMELMPQLIRPGSPRIPAVAFNGSAHTSSSLAGSFLKALGAHDDLPAPIRALLSTPALPAVKEAAR